MEDGPAKRTRSSKTTAEISNGGQITPISTSDSEVFRTPSNSPIKTKKIKKKSRTPSGHLLSHSVDDIRNFFQRDITCSLPNDKTPKLVTHRRTASQGALNVVNKGIATNHALTPIKATDQRTILLSTSTADEGNKQQDSENSVIKSNQSWEVLNETSKRLFEKEKEKEKEINKSDNWWQRVESDKMEDIMSELSFKANTSQQLQERKQVEYKYREDRDKMITQGISLAEQQQQIDKNTEGATANFSEEAEGKMDIKMVYQMFKELQKDIVGGKIVNGETRIQNLERRQDEIIDTIYEIKTELLENKMKSKMLQGVVAHMSELIHDNDVRLNRIEVGNMKKSAVFSGLKTEYRKDICKKQLQKFLLEEVVVQVDIEDIFFLTKTSTSPMVINFATIQDKQEVFNNLGNIKGLVNDDGKPFFFSHYLTPANNESRRREMEIIRGNDRLDEKDQCDMTRREGRLRIDGQPYTKKVQTPTIKQILSLSTEDFNETMDFPLKRGNCITASNSSFTAYTASVNSYDDIQKAYRKMKILHASATHIVCAYRIPGVRKFESEDYCEDNDHACGRILLEWMTNNNIECQAIFVVRNYGGEKLGVKRFECYTRAAAEVIKKYPINDITQVNIAESIGSEAATPIATARHENPILGGNNTNKKLKKYTTQNLSQRRSSFGRRTLQARGRGTGNTQRRDDWKGRGFNFSNPETVLQDDEEWPLPTNRNNFRKHGMIQSNKYR